MCRVLCVVGCVLCIVCCVLRVVCCVLCVVSGAWCVVVVVVVVVVIVVIVVGVVVVVVVAVKYCKLQCFEPALRMRGRRQSFKESGNGASHPLLYFVKQNSR